VSNGLYCLGLCKYTVWCLQNDEITNWRIFQNESPLLNDAWLYSYISQSIIFPLSKFILMLPYQKPVTLQTSCWFCSSAIFALPVVLFWTRFELAGGPAYRLGFSFLIHKFNFKTSSSFLCIESWCYINRRSYWLAGKLAASLVVLYCKQVDKIALRWLDNLQHI
jgi:hypothetical protein